MPPGNWHREKYMSKKPRSPQQPQAEKTFQERRQLQRRKQTLGKVGNHLLRVEKAKKITLSAGIKFRQKHLRPSAEFIFEYYRRMSERVIFKGYGKDWMELLGKRFSRFTELVDHIEDPLLEALSLQQEMLMIIADAERDYISKHFNPEKLGPRNNSTSKKRPGK